MRLTTNQQLERFEKYLKLAHAIAKCIARKYGRDLIELRDEAESILAITLAETYINFNPKKSRECTWVYQQLNFRLLDYVCRSKEKAKPFSTIAEVIITKASPNFIKRLLSELDEDAKTVVNTIVQAPFEIADDVFLSTTPHAKRVVRWWLTKNRGWTNDRLIKAWQEVYACL